MKSIYIKSCLTFSSLLLVFALKAQIPTVFISGNSCVGATLTANSNIQPYSIVWFKNGFGIDTAYNVWNTSASTIAGKAGGQAGAGTDSLNGAAGVYVDASGNVYIADDKNYRIQKWSIGNTSGSTMAGGVGQGSGLGQFNGAQNVVINGGALYVSDAKNNRILKFTTPFSQGNNGVVVAGGNGAGSSHKQLNRPASITFDGSGNLFVCDQGNNRVIKFSPPFSSSNNGVIVAGGNGAGTSNKQFKSPYGIFLDATSELYVSDSGNSRVLMFPSGSDSTTLGTLVAGGNGQGANANQLNSPMGIWVDGNKTIYIADMLNNRIQQWTSGAAAGTLAAGGNGIGVGNSQLNNPIAVFMDVYNNLIVSDYSNNRIQMFSPSINYHLATLLSGVYTIKVTTFSGATNTSALYSVSDTLRTIASLQANPSLSVCIGDTIHFSITASNAGATPVYSWFKNGTLIAGANSASYSAYNCVTGDAINCVVQSSYVCPTLLNDTLAADTLTINPMVTPQALISVNTPTDTICAGQQVTFSGMFSNTGNHPLYLWKLNGQPSNVPPTDTFYNTDTLRNGDMVSCELISNAACRLATNVFSLPIAMHVDSPLTPMISIAVAPGDTVCYSDSLFFNSHSLNVGNSPVYQWYDNGNLIIGVTGSTYSAPANPLIGHGITCFVTSSLQCVTNDIAQSDSIHIYGTGYTTFNATATASITNLTFLGESVKFKVTSNAASNTLSYQWRKNSNNILGATLDSLVDNSLVNNDVVDCIVTTTERCINVQTIVSNFITITAPLGVNEYTGVFENVKIYPNPVQRNFMLSGNLNFTDGSKELEIDVVTTAGAIIEHRVINVTDHQFSESFTLPENISPGLYMINLRHNDFHVSKRLLCLN